jgi:hypothetical protein
MASDFFRVPEESGYIQIDHTHLDREKVDIEEASRLVDTRFNFLRRKLIEDLTLGEKTFVYRLADNDLPIEKIKELAEAINAYGRNSLLFVLHVEGLEDKFSAERVNDGLMVARIEPLGVPGVPHTAEQWRKFCDNWLELCTFTHAAFHGRSS